MLFFFPCSFTTSSFLFKFHLRGKGHIWIHPGQDGSESSLSLTWPGQHILPRSWFLQGTVSSGAEMCAYHSVRARQIIASKSGVSLPIHESLLLDDTVRLLAGDTSMKPMLSPVNHCGKDGGEERVRPGSSAERPPRVHDKLGPQL